MKRRRSSSEYAPAEEIQVKRPAHIVQHQAQPFAKAAMVQLSHCLGFCDCSSLRVFYDFDDPVDTGTAHGMDAMRASCRSKRGGGCTGQLTPCSLAQAVMSREPVLVMGMDCVVVLFSARDFTTQWAQWSLHNNDDISSHPWVREPIFPRLWPASSSTPDRAFLVVASVSPLRQSPLCVTLYSRGQLLVSRTAHTLALVGESSGLLLSSYKGFAALPLHRGLLVEQHSQHSPSWGDAKSMTNGLPPLQTTFVLPGAPHSPIAPRGLRSDCEVCLQASDPTRSTQYWRPPPPTEQKGPMVWVAQTLPREQSHAKHRPQRDLEWPSIHRPLHLAQEQDSEQDQAPMDVDDKHSCRSVVVVVEHKLVPASHSRQQTLQTSVPHSSRREIQTSPPHSNRREIQTSPPHSGHRTMQTSAPHSARLEIQTSPPHSTRREIQTSASHSSHLTIQTSAPHSSRQQIQTSPPHSGHRTIQTSAPHATRRGIQTYAPHSSHPTMQTSAPESQTSESNSSHPTIQTYARHSSDRETQISAHSHSSQQLTQTFAQHSSQRENQTSIPTQHVVGMSGLQSAHRVALSYAPHSSQIHSSVPTLVSKPLFPSKSAQTRTDAVEEKVRRLPASRDRPIAKLSEQLLQTYNNINAKYYAKAKKAEEQKRRQRGKERRRQRQAAMEHYAVRIGEVLDKRFRVDAVLGKGSYGCVVKATDLLDHSGVAIKIVKSDSMFLAQAQREIEILKHLQRDPNGHHPNIVAAKSAFMHKSHQCIVFELLSLNLYEALERSHFQGFSLEVIAAFAVQLCAALTFLSPGAGSAQSDIVHLDLKPENVLLVDPQRSAIKLIDFGNACFAGHFNGSYVQSRFYRAPEVLLGCAYGAPVDMWSLGCLLVELHSGAPLFDGADEEEQVIRHVELLGIPPASES